MKETVNLALRLFIITAIAGLLLGFVNSTTAPVIAQQEQEKLQQALGKTYPGAEEFNPIEADKLTALQGENPNIQQVYKAGNGGTTEGYVFDVLGRGGYGGDINFVVGVNGETKEIVGYDVLKSAETPGLGSQIAEEPFVGTVVGNTMNEPMVSAQDPSGDNDVQAISGTTISVNAILDGLNAAVAALPKVSE
ncbi:MAG: FMN-binding protein [Gallicola sp.]|nr:FMN-binding protein [Gallicola sp.]